MTSDTRTADEVKNAPPWLRTMDGLMDRIATIFLAGAEALLVVMLVINLMNIAMRNAGFGSLLWVAPWTGFLMVWCVFLGFFVMYRRGMDITLTFFTGRFGAGGNRIFAVLAGLCGLAVCFVLAIELPQILARQRGVMELVGLQRYWLSIPMVVSAALLVVHFLMEIVALGFGWRTAVVPDETEQLQW